MLLHRTCLAPLCLLLTSSALFANEIPAPRGEQIVDPAARLEKLFTRSAPIRGGLTEGPACAPDGAIYFSDIPMGSDAGMILRFDPRSKTTAVFAFDSHKSNGLVFNAAGELLACEGADDGGRAVTSWNIGTGERKVLCDGFGGKKFNAPNDLCVDAQGRIYFTDPRYVGTEPRELEHRAVYRLDPGGDVMEITHDVDKPNGIGLSPDGKWLYVADHDNGTDLIDDSKPAPKQGKMAIYAFPLGADGKVSGPRKTLLDLGDEKGCDGLTLDEQGNLYLTIRSSARPGVRVINPQGKEIASIPTGPENQTGATPAGLPSNVEFGRGDEAHVLYVTIDLSLYRIPLRVKGLGR